MDKGERIMPVPQGIISTSTGPVDPNAPVEVEVIEEELPVEETENDEAN
jgi:hypothetical protein